MTRKILRPSPGTHGDFLSDSNSNFIELYARVLPTGLERITEGGNSGLAVVDRIAENYGDIGDEAKDLSFSDSVSTTKGATGDNSLASGRNVTASGYRSVSLGDGCSTDGNNAFSSGEGVNADWYNQFSVGSFNTSYSLNIFEVGIGTSTANRKNGLEVSINGSVVMPNLPTVPPSATSIGSKGEIRFDADYIYVCTATNVWTRSALSTW